MQTPLLDTDDIRRAANLISEMDTESITPFQWASVKLFILIVEALAKLNIDASS